MDLVSLLLIAFGLSMDSFAISVGAGFSNKNVKLHQVLLVSGIFGFFHFIMPFFGWFLGDSFKSYIYTFDHWIAFILLSFIGVKMIADSFKSYKNTVYAIDKMFVILGLAVATSLDAFIIGMPLALLEFNLLISSLVISAFAFVFSVLGFYVGKKFGFYCGNKAEIIGGVLLIFIGVKTLIVHISQNI